MRAHFDIVVGIYVRHFLSGIWSTAQHKLVTTSSAMTSTDLGTVKMEKIRRFLSHYAVKSHTGKVRCSYNVNNGTIYSEKSISIYVLGLRLSLTYIPTAVKAITF